MLHERENTYRSSQIKMMSLTAIAKTSLLMERIYKKNTDFELIMIFELKEVQIWQFSTHLDKLK